MFALFAAFTGRIAWSQTTRPAPTAPAPDGRELVRDKSDAPNDPPAAPATYDPVDAYEVRTIEGWTVRVHKRLVADEPALCDRTMDVLRIQLFQVTRVVPKPALEKLRTIPIWVERDDPQFPCMCYHPDPNWLRAHNLNPEKAGGVELSNPRHFVTWTLDQPWMVLHELAHGYHDRFLPDGYDNRDVKAAYRAAVKEKLYESVQRIRGPVGKGYAGTNPMEYFAEATEAFFGTNDFYPFVRPELKEHDPRAYELLRKAWGAEEK